jgi:hypothetical protein
MQIKTFKARSYDLEEIRSLEKDVNNFLKSVRSPAITALMGEHNRLYIVVSFMEETDYRTIAPQ